MWSMRPVSDGGFIVACGGAGDCTGGTYDNPCEYYGQLVRLDANGDVVWNKPMKGPLAYIMPEKLQMEDLSRQDIMSV